jgi:hypothetical protein
LSRFFTELNPDPFAHELVGIARSDSERLIELVELFIADLLGERVLMPHVEALLHDHLSARRSERYGDLDNIAGSIAVFFVDTGLNYPKIFPLRNTRWLRGP